MHLSWTDGKSQHNANRSILRGMQKSQEEFIFRDIFYVKLFFEAFLHLAPRAEILLTRGHFRQIVGNFLFSTFFSLFQRNVTLLRDSSLQFGSLECSLVFYLVWAQLLPQNGERWAWYLGKNSNSPSPLHLKCGFSIIFWGWGCGYAIAGWIRCAQSRCSSPGLRTESAWHPKHLYLWLLGTGCIQFTMYFSTCLINIEMNFFCSLFSQGFFSSAFFLKIREPFSLTICTFLGPLFFVCGNKVSLTPQGLLTLAMLNHVQPYILDKCTNFCCLCLLLPRLVSSLASCWAESTFTRRLVCPRS